MYPFGWNVVDVILSADPKERKTDTAWRKDGDWKARYSRLYSTQFLLRKPQVDESCRISFMSNDATPYTSLLMRMRATHRDTSIYGPSPDGRSTQHSADLSTLLSQHSEVYGSNMSSVRSGDLGGNDTLLLDMIRGRREFENEDQDKHLDLPRDDISEELSGEACVHGLSLRMTDRSVSRSRVSRVSTRRDMDIPSILAYQISSAPGPTILEVPELQKVLPPSEEVPRWSIRRSICPVCSQKWKDKTSINKVKYSGLKRNSSSELPSIIAPARLRASITASYIPKPVVAAVDEGTSVGGGVMRNTSPAWQLTRARRFRIPKLQMPSPEAAAPPSATAPTARKDLDIRVNRFLRDEGTS